jgi:hypothetical protein
MNKGRNKFKKAQRKEVSRILKAFFTERPQSGYDAAAAYLNEKGVNHPNGPWSRDKVSTFFYNVVGGMRKFSKQSLSKTVTTNAPINTTTTENQDDFLCMVEILLASNLDRKTKADVVKRLSTNKT